MMGTMLLLCEFPSLLRGEMAANASSLTISLNEEAKQINVVINPLVENYCEIVQGQSVFIVCVRLDE